MKTVKLLLILALMQVNFSFDNNEFHFALSTVFAGCGDTTEGCVSSEPGNDALERWGGTGGGAVLGGSGGTGNAGGGDGGVSGATSGSTPLTPKPDPKKEEEEEEKEKEKEDTRAKCIDKAELNYEICLEGPLSKYEATLDKVCNSKGTVQVGGSGAIVSASVTSPDYDKCVNSAAATRDRLFGQCKINRALHIATHCPG
ncbi:hypothetical protein [Thalassomonas haliotis]|uniref:Uncharacterized protein n=1 Tax=Thalassomonas haliotis TaxID=485448 RepID=A0ABY7VBR5_9GAMM|nr:hypothetical protein [Thalassomonas haliotis]WDE10770.1 hypothetical protein H3N35_21370 [Thalassomonas haliotis]